MGSESQIGIRGWIGWRPGGDGDWGGGAVGGVGVEGVGLILYFFQIFQFHS